MDQANGMKLLNYSKLAVNEKLTMTSQFSRCEFCPISETAASQGVQVWHEYLLCDKDTTFTVSELF